MRTIKEVITQLMDKAEFNKNGKMGYECYVEKSLLKEAAIYLQDFVDAAERDRMKEYVENDGKLIDAFALYKAIRDGDIMGGLNYERYIREAEPACDIKAIVKEIEETYKQEKDIDSSWAAGLKFSLGIIRSHTKEGIINARNND